MVPGSIRTLLALVLASIACAARAGADCSGEALARDAAPLAAIRARLADASIREDYETEVPAEARADLTALKDELANLVARVVDCSPPGAAPAEIERVLATLAPSASHDGPGYAAALEFAANTGGDARSLLGVVTSFGVPCGSDAALSVFEPVDGRWRERLRWHSSAYENISGAFGSFKFRVSPPDADGRWYVATAHVTPWCSSTWAMIGFEVLRPGASPDEPRVLLKDSRSMWFGGDDYGELVAERDAFEIRYTSNSADMGVHDRPHVRRYAVRGDTLEHTQPVARSARDFVDEWANADWDEARAWTGPRALDRLAALHAKLGPAKERFVSLEFGAQKRCGPDEVEIEATHDAEPLYFRVRGEKEFTLIDARAASAKRCHEE